MVQVKILGRKEQELVTAHADPAHRNVHGFQNRGIKAKRAVAAGRPVGEAVVRVSRAGDDRRDGREAILLPDIKEILKNVVAIEVGEILPRPLKYISDRREPRVAEVVLLHELIVDPPRRAVRRLRLVSDALVGTRHA